VRGLILLLILASPAAAAHDLWVEVVAGDFVLHRGHHSDSDHAGAESLPYPPEFVREALCLALDGTVQARPVGGQPQRVEGPCVAVALLASSGFWSRTPLGTRNLDKREAVQATRTWESVESLKHIAAWSPRLREPLGAGLELLPLADPLGLDRGDKLRLRVVLDGAPLAGATVAYSGDPRAVSDDQGRANVRLRRSGLQQIQASVTLPGDGVRADERVLATTLSFELAP
jgi:nickel transport protein